jgi:hypothetical protein
MISMIGFLVNDDKPVDLGVRFSDKPISPDWTIEQIKQGELARQDCRVFADKQCHSTNNIRKFINKSREL